MRYVAFLLLLLLTAYFLILKPLLIHRGISYGIGGVSFTLSPLTLRIGKVYLLLPEDQGIFFLNLRNLTLRLIARPEISLEEGFLMSVGEGKKGGSRPQLIIPSFLRKVDVRLGSFLFTGGRRGELSLLFEDIELKGGVLRGRVQIYSRGEKVSIRIGSLLLGERWIDIRRVDVSSRLFDFSLRGVLREGDLRGKFFLKGSTREIDTDSLRIPPVSFEGTGTANYRELRMNFSAKAEAVHLKGRRSFENLRTEGKVLFKFSRKLSVEGRLWSPDLEGIYDLKLMPGKSLRVIIERFPLDNSLLRTDQPILGWVRGDLGIDLDRGDLSLFLTGNGFLTDSLSFGRAFFNLSYNYRQARGKVSLLLLQPAQLYLSGNIRGRSFSGGLRLEDLLWVGKGISLFLSYGGRFAYTGKLTLSGKGEFRDLYYKDVALGGGFYSVELRGKRIALDFWGRGFEGYLEGSLKGRLRGKVKLKDFRRRIRGLEAFAEGWVEVFRRGEKTALTADLRRLSVSGRGVDLKGSLQADLRLDKEPEGKLELLLEGGTVPGLKLGKGFLRGEIREGVLRGNYRVEELVEGILRIDLVEKSLRTEGSFRRGTHTLLYSFTGTEEEGSALLKARIHFQDRLYPLEGILSYRGKRYRLRIEPAVWRLGAGELHLGEILLRGDFDRGSLSMEPAEVYLLGRRVITLRQRDGWIDFRKGSARVDLRLEGALRGKLSAGFASGKGPFLLSEGAVDLADLSFFTATPLGGKAEGYLRYNLSYENGLLKATVKSRDRVITFSRYLSLPMDLHLELKLLNRTLAAFLTLWREESGLSANLGSPNLRSYYIYLLSKNLPVLYRSEDLLLLLRISSEGWFEIRELHEATLRLDMLLSGDVEVFRTPGKDRNRGREKAPPQVALDIRFDSLKPVRVRLPEGYIYVKVRGWVGGSSRNPDYSLVVDLISGELSYFGRKFLVRRGTLRLLREGANEERFLDLSLVNPGRDLSIFISLKGDLRDPRLVVWSEPPTSTREILTKLVIGSTAEGIIPVAQALFKQLGYIGVVRSGISSLLGVEITFSTQTSSRGDLGLNLNVRKRISRALSIEYQQSTLRDPRATYYGGSVTLPAGTSFYGRIFSDNTSEVKFRFIRKFDF